MTDSGESMVPKLCAKLCGFCGSALCNDVCSLCDIDFHKEGPQNFNPIEKLFISKLPNYCFMFHDPYSASRVNGSKNISTCFTFGSTNNSGAAADFLSNAKNSCNSCNKRVGLTGFNCRCGNVFCGKHRYPEEHECCVDFKGIGRESLIKDNPVCKGDKLQFRI